ncbi:hypothetical protein RHSP_08859 [Rhizobium freirei PRF 81]|uniref:Uncharacterized protein n=1 Tax=Rhizobium freirei PRF 81 TaxID=363754 RepID=N6U8I7_9HYPH|nr:hypothetical protein RHSP_08859 [Rhizobium freirei PRF 81]
MKLRSRGSLAVSDDADRGDHVRIWSYCRCRIWIDARWILRCVPVSWRPPRTQIQFACLELMRGLNCSTISLIRR